MALILKHQTKEQFLERFRLRYRDSEGIECATLSSWLLNRLDDKDFTDDQIMLSFNYKVPELNQLKTKLTLLRTSLRHIRSAIGG